VLSDGGGHDTPPSTGTGATTEASASTMELPTSTGDTDAGDITRGEVPDCGMIAEAPACKSMVGCLWDDLGRDLRQRLRNDRRRDSVRHGRLL
jgi:hypothetical protein